MANPPSSLDSSSSSWRRAALLGFGLGIAGLWCNDTEPTSPDLEAVQTTVSSGTHRTVTSVGETNDQPASDGLSGISALQQSMMNFQEQCLENKGLQSDKIAKVKCEQRVKPSQLPDDEEGLDLARMTCYGLDDESNFLSRVEVYVGPACDYSEQADSCAIVHTTALAVGPEGLSESEVRDGRVGTLPVLAYPELTPADLDRRRVALETLDFLSKNLNGPLPEEVLDEAIANNDQDQLSPPGTQTFIAADSLVDIQLHDLELLCKQAMASLESSSPQQAIALQNSEAMNQLQGLFRARGVDDVTIDPDQFFYDGPLRFAFVNNGGIDMHCSYEADKLSCDPRITHATDAFHERVLEDERCRLTGASVSQLNASGLVDITDCSSGWTTVLVWNPEVDVNENCAQYAAALNAGDRISEDYKPYFEQKCDD